MIGRLLARYKILGRLGEGVMGMVYKARDTQLERFAAIKVLPAEKLANSDRKLHFIQEAKSASALNHPHIGSNMVKQAQQSRICASHLFLPGVALIGLALLSCAKQQPVVPKFDTPYQAILLDNGQVYYGKLDGLGTPFPALHDVYYTQTNVNPETKQSSIMLSKRGKEWHGPDHMVINVQHILLIEPVSPDSKVAALIAELGKK